MSLSLCLLLLIPGPVSEWQWDSSGGQVDGLIALLLGAVTPWGWVGDVLLSFLLQLVRKWGLGRGHFAVFSGRHHAPQRPAVEHQHGGTPLKTRVASLALPVSVAGFSQRNVSVGVIVAQSCRH